MFILYLKICEHFLKYTNIFEIGSECGHVQVWPDGVCLVSMYYDVYLQENESHVYT